MAHIKNDEFYLYTGLTANGNECFEALEHLNNTGLQFKHLHYGDPRQHGDLITNIKTWFPGTQIDIAMPFVTYVEVYEFQDPVSRVARIVNGLAEIQNINWQELANFNGQ